MNFNEMRKLVRKIMREDIINTIYSEKMNELHTLTGGVGLSSIAEKFGISVDSLVVEFKIGIRYEMRSTVDRDAAKNRVLRNMDRDPRYYTNNSLSEIQLNEYSKGGIFGGKIKIGGEIVPVEVELLGADNKTKVFITKIIGVDKQWLRKLPKDGVLEIPARIFRAPGGGWYKVKTPKVFETVGCGCDVKSKKISL